MAIQTRRINPRAKMTDHQKAARARARTKHYNEYIHWLREGNSSPYAWARSDYFRKAQEAYDRYRAAGGRAD